MAYKISLFDTDYDCIGTGCMSLDYIAYQLQCAGGQDIEIDISSGGGSAFAGVAIYNLLKAYPGHVTTNNISLAGSAASTVWLGGSVRKMSKYALTMIHPAQVGSFGDASELAADAVMIQKVTDNVISILVDVTGQAIEKVTELVSSTTWLNADESLALGLATEIYDTEDKSLEELGITNGVVIMNQVKTAPNKYQQVINKILTKQQPAAAPIINPMTKEEIEAIVNPNNSLMKKVLNFLKLSTNKITTNKGDMFVVGNLAAGSPVFNDEDAEDSYGDAEDLVITNADGKSVTLSIAGGKITNVKKEDDNDDDMDEDDDIDADNKVVLNSAGINFKKIAGKVDHKAVKNAMAKKLGEKDAVVNAQNALIVDLKKQNDILSTAVQRTETEVKNQIISDFVPKTSTRQSRQGETAKEAVIKPTPGSYAERAANMAVNKHNK